MKTNSILPKRRKPTAYAILALLIGPFGVLSINRRLGMVMLLIPILFCLGIAFVFLDGNITELRLYTLNFIPWAVAYHILCSYAAFKATNWFNRRVIRGA